MQHSWTTIALIIVISCNVVECHRLAVRKPLLRKEVDKHTDTCRTQDPDATCKEFVDCAKRFPSSDECSRLGGMLEVPACNYWANVVFNVSVHGNFSCFEKYIMFDYKSLCGGDEEKKNCEKFVSCCNDAAFGNCSRYYSGELERPDCSIIPHGSFDHNEATCYCATDTSASDVGFRTTATKRSSTTTQIATVTSSSRTASKATATSASASSTTSAPKTNPVTSEDASSTRVTRSTVDPLIMRVSSETSGAGGTRGGWIGLAATVSAMCLIQS